MLVFQELREANSAAQRHQDPPEELRCLSQAQELAMVETLHQSQASAPGQNSILISSKGTLCARKLGFLIVLGQKLSATLGVP